MRLLVRVDGGKDIGLGNIYRSLSLVNEFEETGLVKKNGIIFLTGHDDLAAQIVDNLGYQVEHIGRGSLEQEVTLQNKIANYWRPNCVLVDVPEVPDRAGDFYDAFRWSNNVLLVNLSDQNTGRVRADLIIEGDIFYKNQDSPTRPTEKPIYLRGPKYWIVHKEFASIRASNIFKREGILICFGGADPAHLTDNIGVMEKYLHNEVSVTLVVGKGINEKGNFPAKWNVLHNVSPGEMAKTMAGKQIGVISGGLTMYEAACVGLPSIIIAQNEKQIMGAETFSKLGVHCYLGKACNTDNLDIADACNNLLQSQKLHEKMSKLGMLLVDGFATRRIVKITSKYL